MGPGWEEYGDAYPRAWENPKNRWSAWRVPWWDIARPSYTAVSALLEYFAHPGGLNHWTSETGGSRAFGTSFTAVSALLGYFEVPGSPKPLDQ